ncbi:patatin-like phospholipase family protein [Pseudobutyrivibrio xylanivorans]|uniref:Patatin family protein n=1 Tax=Pseudobutyrivibrio xylanivorans TaxID=185007 RepID=A0A5P6VRZ1_PSEXY|nr:patatin family protein [Pseudobutyrivibrio xylanivorans]QFJ55182.1 patatin family protein [Pseudobutyrivibrio xylanivorans]
MKKGLVMEGGAMRGMFTCGVIDVMLENGIEFDIAVGVSAGATFGLNFKSKQIGRPLRYNKVYCNDKRYASFKSLIETGDLYNVPFCYGTLPYELDVWDTETFYNNPMDFYCVATDLQSGNAVYHKCDNPDSTPEGVDIKWIRASASMPVVSRPVKINGRAYLDGGMSDSIPLKFMESQNCDRILVIETQPIDYVKQPQKYMWLIKMVLRNYPKMIETMAKRHEMYNEEKAYIRAQEAAGKVFVIRPAAPLKIGATEKKPEELQRVYELGRAAAISQLAALKAYLG